MARLVILGRQGSGKGTQCSRLADYYGVPHISTGDILRAAVEAGTELGRQAKAVMDAGDLVSDDIMLGIIDARLREEDAAKGFILDGFPRTAAQAEGLAAMLEPDGVDLAVDLEVPDEVVIERMLSRGRADDTEEAIRRRLDLYNEQTSPLLDWFEAQGGSSTWTASATSRRSAVASSPRSTPTCRDGASRLVSAAAPTRLVRRPSWDRCAPMLPEGATERDGTGVPAGAVVVAHSSPGRPIGTS